MPEEVFGVHLTSMNEATVPLRTVMKKTSSRPQLSQPFGELSLT